MVEAVILYVYDLSNGLARQFSMAFLGQHIDAVYHTSIVVYGREYFFGGGIQSLPPGMTPYGVPIEKIELGTTNIPRDVFIDFLEGTKSRFGMANYHLIENNCNHFTNHLSQFLVGADIPEKIRGLPAQFLNTPFGMMVQPMINNFFGQNGWGSAMNNVNNISNTNTTTTNTASSSVAVSNNNEKLHPKTDRNHKHSKLVSSLPLITDDKPILFEKGDIDPLSKKLTEVVKTVPSIDIKEYERNIQIVVNALKSDDPSLTVDVLKYLENLFNKLPETSVFILLEIIRLLLIKPKTSEYFTNSSNTFISNLIQRIIKGDISKQTELISFRLISNCFSNRKGIDYIIKSNLEKTIECIINGLHMGDKVLKRVIATAAYNISLYLNQQHEDYIISLVSAIHFIIEKNPPPSNDQDIDFILFKALGVLLYCSDSAIDILSTMELNFDLYNQSNENIKNIIKEIKILLQ